MERIAGDLPGALIGTASAQSMPTEYNGSLAKEQENMRMTGNTILITGGGTGIGRGLAEAFHKEGNQVVISGRRLDRLEATVAANPGMKAEALDIASGESIQSFAEQIKQKYPGLNVVIHNAGIMKLEALEKGEVADAEAIIATNLLGPIRLTAALLPWLVTKPDGVIMAVSSGLAFVPLSMTPTYCATKAAIHSYAQSLRYQLRQTPVQVIELIPPYVQTELMGARQASDPNAMPLREFVSETMQILKKSPDTAEICVERVVPLRRAEANGNYEAFVRQFIERAASSHTEL